jgi:hypothetical protein
MATFFEQVNEMGLKEATIAKVDEAVERFTATNHAAPIRACDRTPMGSGYTSGPASTIPR